MILAIIQARSSSSRLPGKVVKPILGTPMILLELERVKKAKKIDKIVLATSDDTSDDVLARTVEETGYEVYRGSLDDVLTRYYRCAEKYNADHIVRITGDCPLIDPKTTDMVIAKHLKDKNDYTCNTNPPTYPDGLDVEVFRYSALEKSWHEANLESEREHVTQYMIKHPELFKQGNVLSDVDLSAMRWTVDEPSDFEFVNAIYDGLYENNHAFSMEDILTYLSEHSELFNINKDFMRNEGLAKSLREDRIVRGKDW